MDNDKTAKKWQNSIINECKKILGRELTKTEEAFITSREGFIALEAIEDTVKTATTNELEAYLNSEANE